MSRPSLDALYEEVRTLVASCDKEAERIGLPKAKMPRFNVRRTSGVRRQTRI